MTHWITLVDAINTAAQAPAQALSSSCAAHARPGFVESHRRGPQHPIRYLTTQLLHEMPDLQQAMM